MKGFPRFVKEFSKRFDETHEKLVNILLSLIVFSFMYYALYLRNNKHFSNENKKNLKYEDFLWYSLTLNFTIPFGDIYPESGQAKVLSSVQAIMFWFIMLA